MMIKTDGWHIVEGYEVLLKDNNVVGGKGYNRKGEKVEANLFLGDRKKNWTRCRELPVDIFARRVRSGRIMFC